MVGVGGQAGLPPTSSQSLFGLPERGWRLPHIWARAAQAKPLSFPGLSRAVVLSGSLMKEQLHTVSQPSPVAAGVTASAVPRWGVWEGSTGCVEKAGLGRPVPREESD